MKLKIPYTITKEEVSSQYDKEKKRIYIAKYNITSKNKRNIKIIKIK